MIRRWPTPTRHLPPLLAVMVLGLFPALAAAQSAPPTVSARPNCESTYPGITYCVEDRDDIHIVIIDLDNPYIRFETVMAGDVTRVDTDERERVEEMVTRPPYADQPVVVAINADYFGHTHGPEGLTVKNGQRLDGDGLDNPNALWRSSLAISRLNRVSLGRKSAEDLTAPRAYRERFYNAVGGAPLILSHGVVIPNMVACLLERFPIGACRRTIQTTVGLSANGRWLYLAVGQGRDVEGFAHLLRDYGAFTAIKLDGGGSSQLWYDGQMRHDSDRPVANALFVLYSPIPRHGARWQPIDRFAIAGPGERVSFSFELVNTGFLDWQPDLGYRFKNIQGWPVVGPAYQRLPATVATGSTLTSALVVIAPQTPGVYQVQWQLVRRAEPIGERMGFVLVVIPPWSDESGLRAYVEELLAHIEDVDPETEWVETRQVLERAIWSDIADRIRTALDDGHGLQANLYSIASWLWWLPPHWPLAW